MLWPYSHEFIMFLDFEFRTLLFCLQVKQTIIFTTYTEVHGPSADSEGGVGVVPPLPLRFVRGGVLCIGLMGRRGVQWLFLPYYYHYTNDTAPSFLYGYSEKPLRIRTNCSWMTIGDIELLQWLKLSNLLCFHSLILCISTRENIKNAIHILQRA